MSQDKPKKKDDATIGMTGWWVIIATVSASSMAFFMQSALNIALPSLQDENTLNASGADLVWITNAYQLVLSAFLLLGGSMGDHYGRKRIYMIGIVIFTVACVLCGLAPNTQTLIAFRAVQGIGGALMIPGSLAIISAYFDDNTRGKAIGTWSSFTTAASVLAPILGGFLASAGLWRAIFFLCVPFAAISLYALVTRVPESKDDEMPKGLDITGTIAIAVGLTGLVYGATEIGNSFSGSSNTVSPVISIGALVIGIIGLIVFYFIERNSDHPLVPLKLFKSRTFSGVNLLTLFLYGALAGALFFLPLNLIQIQGYNEVIAGIATLPITVALILMSGWAGGLVDSVGPRPPLIGGPALVGVGFIALSIPGITSGVSAYWWTYFPGMLLMGVGMGLTVAPLTTSALGSVPQRNSGVASGVNNLMSRAAGVLAVAMMGGLALVTFSGTLQASTDDLALREDSREQLIANSGDLARTQIPDSVSDTDATAVKSAIDTSFVTTFRLMMWIGAALAFLSAILAFIMVEAELKPPPELQRETVPA